MSAAAAGASGAMKVEMAFQAKIEKMCSLLLAEIATKHEQVRCLQAVANRENPDVTPEFLLTLYCMMPSARDAAEFVNSQGWKVPGVKGPREVTPADVYKILRGDPCTIGVALDPVVLKMAREKLKAKGGWLPR